MLLRCTNPNSAFDDRPHHSLSVLNNQQLNALPGIWCVWWNMINGFVVFPDVWRFELTRGVFSCSSGRRFLNTSITVFNDTTTESVLRDTAVCLLHAHDFGAHV